MSIFYAGIGARATPDFWLDWFSIIATRLDTRGFVLRSGGANGADSAFWLGAGDNSEIYLPWRGFNSSESSLYGVTQASLKMAEYYHPAWERCSRAARKFHARNCFQMLGRDLHTPSSFVVCWTPNGESVGGTGQALRIAEDLDIPVFNFGHANPNQVKEDLTKLISQLQGDTND